MDTEIRTTPSVGEANEWALVLAASGIAFRVDRTDTGWAVLAPEEQAARARRALAAYDADEARRPRAAPPPERAASARVAWLVGAVAGALLLAFFAVTGPPETGAPWFAAGAAASGRMLHGEPWRAVTALTLHLDAVHVLGNAIAAALLLPPLVERLGPGLALWLALLAGAGGNLASAALQGFRHVSAGASTAMFGAIGALAGLRLRSGPTPGGGARRLIVPVAALLLLAMLGTAPGADVLAHALGALVGGVLGLAAARIRRRLPAPVEWVLLAALALAIGGSWHLALAGRAR